MTLPLPVLPPWPKGAEAAVSLTYDDCLDVHLDHAAVDLEAAGFRGTFYLSLGGEPGSCFARRHGEWAAMAARGHEIGNHTRHHPCSRRLPFVKPGFALEDYDLARMRAELLDVEADIEGVAGSRPHSFAYPCGQTTLGEPRVSYRELVRELFPVARGVTPRAFDPSRDMLDNVPSHMPRTGTGIEWFRSRMGEALRTRSWVVFTFHGVGGGHPLDIDRSVHQQLLADLRELGPRVWVVPFVTVAQPRQA